MYTYMVSSSAAPGNGPEKKSTPFVGRLQALRIKQSLCEKQALEKKLRYIEDNIGLLSSMELERSSKSVREYSWLTAEERKKWKEDSFKKAQDAEEFVKKVSAIRKELKQRKCECDRAEQERLAREEAERKAQEQAEAARKLKEREEEKARRAEEMETKRKERQLLAKLATETPARKEYLYQKMTQQYQTAVEMPELEKRKREIADKRNVYRPIRLADMAEFQKRHDQQIRASEDDHRKEQLRLVQDQRKYQQKVEKELKSTFTDEVIRKDNEAREKVKEEEGQVKERYTKMKEYARVVKEEHQPVASETKALELKKQIEQLKHHPRKSEPRNAAALTPSARNNSLTARLSKETGNETPSAESGDKDRKTKFAVPRPKQKRNSGSMKSMEVTHEKPREQPREKRPNYLAELAKNLPELARRSLLEQNFQKVLADDQLTVHDRYQLIKSKAEMLEQSARQKEMLLSAKAGGDAKKSMELGKEVSDMYISAMRAKLSLLGA